MLHLTRGTLLAKMLRPRIQASVTRAFLPAFIQVYEIIGMRKESDGRKYGRAENRALIWEVILGACTDLMGDGLWGDFGL